MPPYLEFRKVNGAWTQVATIGGQRCDSTQADMNDGRALIVHRPRDGSYTQTPAEIFASSLPPPGLPSQAFRRRHRQVRLPINWFGFGGTIRGDTIYIDNGYLYRNAGGTWVSAGRLNEPEVELNLNSSAGKLRGSHLFLAWRRARLRGVPL